MRYLLIIFLALWSIQPAAAQNNAVQQAENYLRGLGTVKADFIQRSDMGGMLSGVFYLDRPGKLRFEYNEVKDFIVADGYFIYFYDSELGEQSNAPIGQTLADFLLREDLKLRDDITVQEVFSKDGFTHISLTQTDDPSAGQIQLIFSEVPYALRKWRVTDAQGQTTEIELKNMQRDVDLNSKLFAYHAPKGRKKYND